MDCCKIYHCKNFFRQLPTTYGSHEINDDEDAAAIGSAPVFSELMNYDAEKIELDITFNDVGHQFTAIEDVEYRLCVKKSKLTYL